MQPTEDALVFIVDDDAGVREALAWLLRSRRLPSQSFDSADAFAEFLGGGSNAWQPSQPGCLLLDVRMPGMSGLALFEHLIERQLLDALPVIFLTGHADVPTAVDSVKRGAFDFVKNLFQTTPWSTALNKPWRVRRKPCKAYEPNKTCNTTWPI